MFSKIDIFLILRAQWCVRQIELYTNKTRQDIFSLLFGMTRWSITATVICCLIALKDHIWSPILILPMYFFIAKDTKEYKEIINKSDSIDTLPVEILTRISHRRIILLVGLFFSCIISIHKFNSAFEMVIMYLQWISLFMIPICIEYLLCTTSLPPGEKERKKIEKEMSSLVPIKIRN